LALEVCVLQIRRGTHRSTRPLEAAIKHCVKVNNADPKPIDM
jgi:hypothetical protein